MGTELAPWRPPQMTLSLEQRSLIARKALSRSTTATEAAKAAKRLIGSYAFVKVHDADAFNESIAAVLSQYPAGLVEECCDPRTGAARKIKFLSVAELVTWLDQRLEYHKALAKHVPRQQLPAPAPRVYPPEHKATMVQRFGELVKQLFAASREDPITKLRREARERDAAQLVTDRARALSELGESA